MSVQQRATGWTAGVRFLAGANEVYKADLERNRQRLREEDAELEIERLTRHINVLQENLKSEITKNAELHEDLNELRQVKSVLAQERKLLAEKEEIFAKQKMDLDSQRKEIDKQKTNIALLRAQLAGSECKMSEFQHQIDESNWSKELELRDKEIAAMKCHIALLQAQLAGNESPGSRLQH